MWCGARVSPGRGGGEGDHDDRLDLPARSDWTRQAGPARSISRRRARRFAVHSPTLSRFCLCCPGGNRQYRFVSVERVPSRVGAPNPGRRTNAEVGWPGASQPRAPTESVRNGLPLYGSCRPGHLAAGFAQAQCAKYRGRVAAASAMDRVAFFQVRSFLYLFMIHPIR